MIRPMTHMDALDATALYTDYMYDSFFVTLGPKFIQLVFQGIATSHQTINYVYEVDKHIIAFISATVSSRTLFRQILQDYKIPLISTVFHALVRKPWLLWRLLEPFFYFKKTRLTDAEAELLFIAIDPSYRKRGIAEDLIMVTLQEFKRRGITKVKVTTVKHNTIVNNLLKKLGFNIVGSFTFYGKENLLYDFSIL